MFALKSFSPFFLCISVLLQFAFLPFTTCRKINHPHSVHHIYQPAPFFTLYAPYLPTCSFLPATICVFLSIFSSLCTIFTNLLLFYTNFTTLNLHHHPIEPSAIHQPFSNQSPITLLGQFCPTSDLLHT